MSHWKKLSIMLLLMVSLLSFSNVSAARAAAPASRTASWSSVEELTNYAANSINGYWADIFATHGFTYYPPTHFVGYTRPVWVCNDILKDNAEYCRLDHSIRYDINFFNTQWRKYGDFAPVTILAHEWGHLVQAHFNLGSQPYAELQADCFAGSYAYYAAQHGLLEPGDLDEAAASLYSVGDPNLPPFTPNTHGRPEERIQAFRTGLLYGAESCFQEY